jgi:predicted RNA-binding Zn ribbon-like protein
MNNETHPHDAPLVVAVREELCLDYANTRYWRGSDAPTETLHGFDDLLEWLARGAHPAPLIATARTWGRDASAVPELFAEAIAIREAVYRIFSGLAAGEPVADRDLARLNQALAEAPARRRIARHDDGYGWLADIGNISAATLLAPVLWSAAELLLSAPHRRIRRCANDRCLWLFVDTSKSGTRRWCDMSSCGNRAKAARHYSKVRRGTSG